MSSMKLKVSILFLVLSLTPFNFHLANQETVRTMDVAICVDLSGSSNGILDDIRDRIWEVVNQVNNYKPTPKLRIAVVGFSRPSFGAKTGYVKVITGLTDDYDFLSNELFKMQPYIEKGDQMVGMALRTCIKSLRWSESSDAIKVIYLIGNGRVDLGPMNYLDACEMAVKEGIVVNTMYCRTTRSIPEEEVGWRTIAKLTGGKPYDIFIHRRPPVLLTSNDTSELLRLSKALTSTYAPYGRNGEDRLKMMTLADQKANESSMMSYESRLYFKISNLYQYRQFDWDMVDYFRINKSLPNKSLSQQPDSLKNVNEDVFATHISKLRDTRKDILARLRNHLPLDRQDQINRMLDERGISKSQNFERTMINSLNQMASSNGYALSYMGKFEFNR